MYTTVEKVRQDSGFVNNTNVTDAFISQKIIEAEGLINGYISRVYALPLPRYYTRQIVFSGTGSGTGTMTVTIGGESFVLDITSGLTAAQAADLLRAAAASSEVIVTDGMNSGATVLVYSRDGNDPDQLAITSTNPQTVQGVTATASAIADAIVPMVATMATQIAAAFVLIVEYGKEAQDIDKDGFRRLALAKAALKEIADGLARIYDFAGEEIPRTDTTRVRFYPTRASRCDPNHPTKNRLPIDKRY